MARPLLIANLQAGPAWRRANARRVLARALRDREVEVVESVSFAEAGERVRQAALGGRRVIAAGGDGTIQAIAATLIAAAPHCARIPTLGIVPLGRGNDLARSLGVPRGVAAALDLALSDRVGSLDVGQVEVDGARSLFVNALGIGFDAAVAWRAHGIPAPGFSGYLVAALWSIAVEPGPWHLQGVLGGEPWSASVTLMSLGNGATTGGGFQLTPGADPGDGALDFCCAQAPHRLAILDLLPRALLGKLRGDPRIRLGRLGGLELQADPGVPIHADGELLARAARWIRVTLLPAALQVARIDGTRGPSPAE